MTLFLQNKSYIYNSSIFCFNIYWFWKRFRYAVSREISRWCIRRHREKPAVRDEVLLMHWLRWWRYRWQLFMGWLWEFSMMLSGRNRMADDFSIWRRLQIFVVVLTVLFSVALVKERCQQCHRWSDLCNFLYGFQGFAKKLIVYRLPGKGFPGEKADDGSFDDSAAWSDRYCPFFPIQVRRSDTWSTPEKKGVCAGNIRRCEKRFRAKTESSTAQIFAPR